MLTTLAAEVPSYAVSVEVGREDGAVGIEQLEQIGTFGGGDRAGQLGFERAEIGDSLTY